MRKVLFVILGVFFLAAVAANSFAADCRILGAREIPGTTSGVVADFEVVVSLAGTGGGQPFFNGQKAPDDEWVSHPIKNNGDGTATATISGYKAGEFIEFSYGAQYWTTPSCSAYHYNGHFRVKLGEPKTVIISPWLSLLLPAGEPIQPKVISIVESNVSGPTAYYHITVGLDSLPAGLPFFTGQSYSDGPWVYYGISDNGDGTATTIVPNWSRGSFFEFTFGTVSGSVQNWVDPKGSSYLHGSHFGATLGQAQICSISGTGDSLVRRVTSLGGDRYRVFLNFPMEEGYRSLFLRGQSSQDGPWVDWTVVDNYPCHYVDIHWPYDGTFHFSFGIIKNDGSERWVDPLPSVYRCNDHLCINFRYP